MDYGILLSSGGSTSGISPITTAGTELLTWVVTSMTSLWGFIIANPLLATLCSMLLISFAAGLFFRFARSL